MENKDLKKIETLIIYSTFLILAYITILSDSGLFGLLWGIFLFAIAIFFAFKRDSLNNK